MNKSVWGVVTIGFIVGLITAISRIEDLNLIGVDFVMYLLYALVLIGSIIFINEKIERKGFNILSFPLVSFIMYVPVNVLAGVYYNGEVRYYRSFPRYFVLLYYGLFLLFLYVAAYLINRIFRDKFSKIVYIITDVLSLLAIPFLVIATYFVSPHG